MQMVDPVRRAPRIEGDDRYAAQHRLRNHHRPRIGKRWTKKEVRRLIDQGHHQRIADLSEITNRKWQIRQHKMAVQPNDQEQDLRSFHIGKKRERFEQLGNPFSPIFKIACATEHNGPIRRKVQNFARRLARIGAVNLGVDRQWNPLDTVELKNGTLANSRLSPSCRSNEADRPSTKTISLSLQYPIGEIARIG